MGLWKELKIGDFLTFEYGKPLDRDRRKPDGKYPAYGANGVKCWSDDYLCDENSIIVGRKGSAGEITLTEEKYWPLDVTYFVKFDHSQYDLMFVFHLLSRLDLPSLATGVKPGINRNNVYDIKVQVPELTEQKRIVTILDQAFTDIDRARQLTEQNLQNARELFDSYLQQVFSQRGEGWDRIALGQIGKVSMCKRILKKQTSATGEIPFFKIGTFGKAPDAYIDKELYQSFREKYSFPKKGDILISASGTIGRRVVYDGEPAYFQDSNIVWIDNDENLVLNEYLYQFYAVCDWNPSKGATISRLYNDDLRAIEISFPSKQIQNKLVEEMKELYERTQALQTIYQNKLASLDELKKSLLQKAFSGELTQTKEGEAA